MADWGAHQHSFIENQRNALLNAIAGWIESTIEKLSWTYAQGRGWENWMQVDWNYYLMHQFANIGVAREAMVWTTNPDGTKSQKQVDFVILVNGIGYIMELKCFINGASATQWKDYLDADFAKLHRPMGIQGPKPIKFGVGVCLDTTINPGGAYQTSPGTATDQQGNQHTYNIHYRSFV